MTNFEYHIDSPEGRISELERRLEARVRQVDAFFSIQKQLVAALEGLDVAFCTTEDTAETRFAGRKALIAARAAIARAKDGAAY